MRKKWTGTLFVNVLLIVHRTGPFCALIFFVLFLVGITGGLGQVPKPAAGIIFGLFTALSIFAPFLVEEIFLAPLRSRKNALCVSRKFADLNSATANSQHIDHHTLSQETENSIMRKDLGAIELQCSLSQALKKSNDRPDSILPDCSPLSSIDTDTGAGIQYNSIPSIYALISESEIRLLQIEGSRDEKSLLQMSLVHVPLLAARTRGFVALSYTWTKTAATSLIFVNGNLIRVRPNLAEILRKMRLLKHKFIWVDALCINQADVQERSQQVLRMGGIYGGALSVIVCINTSQSDCLASALTLVNLACSEKNQSDQLHQLCRTDYVQSAVKGYCLEDYWRRIWIIQEFAIGHEVHLLIGDKTFSAQSLYLLIRLLERNSVRRELSQTKAIFDIRRSWQRNMRYRLLEILKQTTSSICDRRHDRIYGLLGLAGDFLDYFSEPDYEMSTFEVSISMARSYIERRSMNIILMSPHHAKPSGLPTWCPNYLNFDSFPPENRIVKLVCHHLDYFQAASENPVTRSAWNATKSAPRTCTFDDSRLLTSAHRVSKISSLGHAWSDSPSYDFPVCSGKREQTPKNWKAVGQTLNAAMLRADFSYPPNFSRGKQRLTPHPSIEHAGVQDFCFLQLFSPTYGDFDPDQSENTLHRWVSANRKFVFGGRALEEHAEKLWPIFFHCGFKIWHSSTFGHPPTNLFEPLIGMAEQDMLLMCLDDDKFGIGWAAKGARLDDEIFLIPGCSVPVILRRAETNGQYRMVGDAIVIGAMEGEVWEEVRPDDLCQIEII